MTLVALTRAVSPSLANCELTHLERVEIDIARARAQHAAYEDVLRTSGVHVEHVAAAPDAPDAVFIEDIAIVLDELAVLTLPGATSRREERPGVERALATYRAIERLESPATLDGGDVLRVGRVLYVGRSGRSNDEGRAQLQRAVERFGYDVVGVDFSGCLHLKSAATLLGDRLLLVNPNWVSIDAFVGCAALDVDPLEPHSANVLRVGDTVIASAQYPRTNARIADLGIQLAPVDTTELAKAEGAVTCCSLVLDGTPVHYPGAGNSDQGG